MHAYLGKVVAAHGVFLKCHSTPKHSSTQTIGLLYYLPVYTTRTSTVCREHLRLTSAR